ncbi:MAG: sigma-54 interaction domain-containing protein, partial [Fidelibacterota bacterium]
TTVLITGETGTGKELAAKAIHFLSARSGKPLMTVNCAAMPDQLIESELFGHEKGAFTDAKTQKKGILELAQGGTVFLDEIGDISSALQSKILRVLENKTFKRVGGTVEIAADVRFISATNQPLEQRLSEGKFRRDLYYRLDVVHVHIPPLRERGEDVLLLSQYFLEELNGMFHKNFKGLSDEVKSLFLRYEWPGNVRELRNVLERAVLLSDDEFVTLPHIELAYSRLAPGESQTFQLDFESKDFSMDQLEKKILLHALEKTGGNQSQAARLLKISRDTLRYRMKKHNLLKK